MSLDLDLWAVRRTNVYGTNMTHNVAAMADEAGVYDLLWQAKGSPKAGDLVAPLNGAIYDMEARPDHYKKFDAENGWGTYEQFLPWLREVRDMCVEYPDAEIEVSR